MSDPTTPVLHGVIVEDEIRLTLDELGRACRAERSQLVALVEEGVLHTAGRGPDDWRFGGDTLRRARTALRLARDLELGLAGTALVMELLDDIESLRSQLRRAGLR